MFLEKSVLKICSKFTEEHPCRSVISIKLQSNFIEITLQHGCSLLNLLHIFRTPFTMNTSGRVYLSGLTFSGLLSDYSYNNINKCTIKRKAFDTQNALLFMVEKMLLPSDKKELCEAILTDLLKAFDCISHDLLIAKLNV